MSEIVADIVGNVWKVLVAEGDEVQAGECLAIIETMKMEIPVPAPQGGQVTTVLVSEGDVIAEGEVMLIVNRKQLRERVEAASN